MTEATVDQPTPVSSGADKVLPTTRRGRWLVVLVLVVGLGLRVGAVMQNRSTYVPKTDAAHFDYIATSLSNGHGYGYAILAPNSPAEKMPSAMRAPLYPFSLAAVYAVAGHSWTAGRLANGLIGLGVVALVGIIAAQIWSRRVGFVALVIAAVYPAMTLTGSSLQLEPLLVLTMLGALAAALQHRRSRRRWEWVAVAGVCTGLAVLTRETGVFVLPAVVWLVWPTGDQRPAGTPRFGRRVLALPALAVVLSILVVLPWTIRNAVTLHAFVPVSTSAGIGLAGTFNNTSLDDRSLWRNPALDPAMRRKILSLQGATEVEADNQLTDASVDVIKHRPSKLFTTAFWNTERLFDLDGGAYSRYIAKYVPYSPTLTNLSVVTGWIVMLLALAGIFFFHDDARRAHFAIWTVPILTYVFMVFLLPASIRYRAAMEPFFIFLAALPITAILDWVIDRWNARGQASASA